MEELEEAVAVLDAALSTCEELAEGEHLGPALCAHIKRIAHRAHGLVTFNLLKLPDELLDHILEHISLRLLTDDVRSLLALQCCRTLRTRLQPFVETATAARRLQWEPEAMGFVVEDDYEVSHDQRQTARISSDGLGWAVGGHLPAHPDGRCSFKIRVENISNNVDGVIDGSAGEVGMTLGVCEASSAYAWGLCLGDGCLDLWAMLPDGRVRNGGAFPGQVIAPAGWPQGRQGHKLMDSLNGLALDAVIEIIVDYQARTLSFCVNGGPEAVALHDFPAPGGVLRPFAMLYGIGDSVRFVGPLEIS